jgi:hypothetical protein
MRNDRHADVVGSECAAEQPPENQGLDADEAVAIPGGRRRKTNPRDPRIRTARKVISTGRCFTGRRPSARPIDEACRLTPSSISSARKKLP